MTDNPFGWRAMIQSRINVDHHDLYLARSGGNGMTLVYNPLTGQAGEVPVNTEIPDVYAYKLPIDALVAIRDAIDVEIGRRYDESLVQELRTSLDVERARVDRVITKVVGDA